MNIKDIKDTTSLRNTAILSSAPKRYPDWIGSEKYIVITDDAEKDLLASGYEELSRM